MPHSPAPVRRTARDDARASLAMAIAIAHVIERFVPAGRRENARNEALGLAMGNLHGTMGPQQPRGIP